MIKERFFILSLPVLIYYQLIPETMPSLYDPAEVVSRYFPEAQNGEIGWFIFRKDSDTDAPFRDEVYDFHIFLMRALSDCATADQIIATVEKFGDEKLVCLNRYSKALIKENNRQIEQFIRLDLGVISAANKRQLSKL